MTQLITDAVKPHLSGTARRRIVRTRFAIRLVTARYRVLPDFLVIGGMRCGTSSLYKYLGYHPCVAPSLRKETHYFTQRLDRGERWYRAHFPLSARVRTSRALGRPLCTFEATPDYIFAPHAAAQIHAALPDIRVIALLRNPVDRAYSHYRHVTRLGWETLSFEEAVAREQGRTREGRSEMEQDPSAWSGDWMAFSYVDRGMYADQLGRWLRHYPADRLLALSSEEMYRNPAQFWAQVLDFLDLPAWQPRFANYSRAGASRPASEMSPAVRATLEETFREPNARLFTLLGRDFGWNRT